MLTARGWLTGVLAAALLVAGRVFGIIEAYVAGAVLVVLLVASVLWLVASKVDVDVRRRLHPPRVHAGTASRVDLVVTNRGARRTPLLTLRDAVSGTRGATLLVSPLGHEEQARAAYRFPTERRGVVTVGPLEVEIADPLMLARLRLPASDTSELIVYPRIEPIPPVPLTSGNDPLAGAEHPNALGRQGEDFYALRRYVVGDDLRRVHWAATARHDELMVRQDELPWQGRATVVVDTRATAHTPETFERAVSAAASVVTAAARRQDLIRLVSLDGADSGFSGGHSHAEALLEHLACLEPTTDAVAAGGTVDRLAAGPIGGALVVMTGGAGEELPRVRSLGSRYGLTVVLAFHPDPRPLSGPGPDGVTPVGSDTPLSAAWAEAVRRRDDGRRPRAGAGR